MAWLGTLVAVEFDSKCGYLPNQAGDRLAGKTRHLVMFIKFGSE